MAHYCLHCYNLCYLGQLRLIGDEEIYGRGLLQIYSSQFDVWGSINSVGFDYREAQVACRSMG